MPPLVERQRHGREVTASFSGEVLGHSRIGGERPSEHSLRFKDVLDGAELDGARYGRMSWQLPGGEAAGCLAIVVLVGRVIVRGAVIMLGRVFDRKRRSLVVVVLRGGGCHRRANSGPRLSGRA